jgi:hypothetical protein
MGSHPMKYLGIAHNEKERVLLPDAFIALETTQSYEVIEVGGDIFLLSFPLDRKRLSLIEKLTQQAIDDHRETLEGLAR